jgi:hypothetical protein
MYYFIMKSVVREIYTSQILVKSVGITITGILLLELYFP